MENISESFVAEVSQIFPHLELSVIRDDLSYTGSTEETVNRILNGTVCQSISDKGSSDEKYACSSTDINSDSDLELPLLKVSARKKLPGVLEGREDIAKPSLLKCDVSESLSDTEENSDSDLPELDVQPEVCKSDHVANDPIDLTQDRDDLNEPCDYRKLKITSRKAANKPRMDISEFESDLDVSLDRPTLAEKLGFKSSSSVGKENEYQNLYGEDQTLDTFDGGTFQYQEGTVNSVEGEELPALKKRKKRSAEEIAKSKRQAEEKRAERIRVQEEKKAQKQRESEMKKALQENKRHYRAGDCVKYLTVCVDPGVINNGQLGASIFKVCEDLGAKCVSEPQLVPNTISWRREVLDCHQPTAIKKDVVEDDVLAMIPITDLVSMVHNYIQSQRGLEQSGDLTVKEYIQTVKSVHAGKTVAVFVIGKEKYFNDQKLANKRNHREAVLATGTGEISKRVKGKKGVVPDITVSRIQMEEALIDAQLHTGCIVQFTETSKEAADLVKCFTKAVADKPAKKDRLENVFDFLAEGAAGVKVDKAGNGLLKVWKHQLLQFKNVGPDMAEAIISVYPSPKLLFEAYKKCTTESEAQKLLENIVVRRGAGVLVTNRRIGKEISRKIHALFTSTDPDFTIK